MLSWQRQRRTRCALLLLRLALLLPTSLQRTTVSAMTLATRTLSPNNQERIAPSRDVYDVVIVGGGSAGLTAAKFIGPTLGKTCCIIEEARMGGDCTWTGCIPSKSLIHASKQTNEFRQIQELISNNIQQIYTADDSPEALKELGGIDVISGTATLQSSKSVTVRSSATEHGMEPTVRTIQAKSGIILCTGAAPKVPSDIPGLTSYYTYESMWDKEALLDADRPPTRLTVIGGGAIGCEMAQAMARLGSQVTLVTSSSRLLPQEDVAVGTLLHDIFTKENKIQILYGRVTKVEQPDSPASQSHTAHVVASDGFATMVQGDAILVAIGREPRCRGLGLEALGVNVTGNAIAVNAQLETSVKGIYAAGDCTGDRQFTHYAGYQGAIAARNILLPFSDPGVLPNVPSTIFTSPEVASIGLSEAKAAAQYGMDRIVVYQRQLSHVDRAVCDSAQAGFIKIICLQKSNVIVGAFIVAPVAGEMIAEIAVLMRTKMPFDQLATVMHPYPTYTMALQLMAAEVYYEKTKKLTWLFDFLKWLGL